jgi:hypothetical protein
MNQRYSLERDKLKEFADRNFSEADLVFLLGFPFKNLASFNMQGKSGDIEIESLGLIVEVKYLRNTKSGNGNYTNTPNWKDTFEKDFEWLCNNIREGNKGKRAFILGWFNVVDSFSQIMHLGMSNSNKSSGWMPEINKDRLSYFPFLNVPSKDSKTRDISYMYSPDIYTSEKYEPSTIKVEGLFNNYVHCLFVGKKTDKFHFAIYY